MRLKLNTTSSFIVPFHIHFKLIVYKKTGEWQQVVQRVTAIDNKWQRMTTSGTTSDNEWQWRAMSDSKWEQWYSENETENGTVQSKNGWLPSFHWQKEIHFGKKINLDDRMAQAAPLLLEKPLQFKKMNDRSLFFSINEITHYFKKWTTGRGILKKI